MSRADKAQVILMAIGRDFLTKSYTCRAVERRVRVMNASRGKYPRVRYWVSRADLIA